MSEKKRFEHIKLELPKKLDKDGNLIREGIDGNYAVISINRPDRLNAITIQTIREIAAALEDMVLDQDIRCVVLRGTKEFTKKPAFSVGQDLSAVFIPGIRPNIPWHMSYVVTMYHNYFNSIEAFPKPLIAAVDGYALGGGTELTLLCDISIASKRSTFGFTEIQRGIFPAAGGTQRMIRHIGLSRATRMLYFGEKFSAEQIHEWGLITFLAEDDEFEEVVHEKAKILGNAATTSLIIIKKCIRFGTQVPLDIGLQFEQLGFGVNFLSEDVKEGVQAFLKKRKPIFKGR